MARKRAGGQSKSDMIRSASLENPTAGPTEIAKLIETAHKIKISPAMVSTVLSQDRNRGGKPAKRGRPPKSGNKVVAKKTSTKSAVSGMSVEALIRIKQLADEMGGINEAKKALDALSQIIG